MQDITEQQELAQEISDAISKPVSFGEEFDEVCDFLEIFCFCLCDIFLNTLCDSEKILNLKLQVDNATKSVCRKIYSLNKA